VSRCLGRAVIKLRCTPPPSSCKEIKKESGTYQSGIRDRQKTRDENRTKDEKKRQKIEDEAEKLME
jgi:hypothetical protein